MTASERSKRLSELRQIASIYQSELLKGPNEKYHTFLRDSLIPSDGGRTALELGCGNGLWTEILCCRYDHLEVVDGSKNLIENIIARFQNQRARLVARVALIEDFLEKSQKLWQHIYITFLLEHLDDPIHVLKMARNHLEPGGKVFVAVPNAESVHRVLALRAGMISSTNQLSENDICTGHRRVYTSSLLHEHLSVAGFVIVKENSIGLKPLTIKQLEVLPISIITALCASGDLTPNNSAYLTAIAKPK